MGGINLDYVLIGQQVRKYRKALGLSQEELAERAELITVSLERDWVRCLRFRGETISAESLFEDLLQLGK